MLAVAAHGEVTTMDRRYIGWPELSPAAAAREDPLFHDLPGDLEVIKWHADAISPPPSAAVLGSTASPGSALFRIGDCAWGSQMHLESTWEMLFDRWLPDPVEHRALLEAGHEPESFARQCRQLLPRQISTARPVFRRFAQQVAPDRSESAPAPNLG
jgi:GMP synthase-like glutamine amidotransferase